LIGLADKVFWFVIFLRIFPLEYQRMMISASLGGGGRYVAQLVDIFDQLNVVR